ncbi:hypothetical protein VB715_02000 [Crocosphaera sp. UHCC 0190]|nr:MULTISPECIES: hypothetical protein [unclassified Crocosphaera]MEA5508528.1 hypothetical protein [Crocosphaera sp. UHCC 0190]MEA5532583.1 hypothetical protein [Crocosphaera sp. XPORK-15E]
MSQTPKQPSTNDLASDRTELAKYRSRAAADRKLVSYVNLLRKKR